ncbi:hypothetical protein KFK09_002129 [Dendrobium nobile]|uniref:Uncharacterized protein n=1 Tax=Dendrobium nobile TaxID=94219 RepID=A0A8T3C6Q9_DENNO|nr:hypothetical protein KFK09_002129 [Dendrobium nobile]
MATKAPIFPMPIPHHYSDYGFDPEIDYFQALEEARRHGKRSDGSRSADALHFKLQKPISKEERTKSKKRRQWWKNAFGLFWKSRRSVGRCVGGRVPSGPLYATESMPCRAVRANSGPLSAAEFMETQVPYFSLRDLNLLESNEVSAGEATMRPIYLVT